MTDLSQEAPSALPAATAPSVGVESLAVYAALGVGAAGGLLGLLLALGPPLSLFGGWSFGTIAAIAAGIAGACTAIVGYWRVRVKPGQEWRRSMASPLVFLSFSGVVLVHSLLSALATVAVYLVLSLGFRGLILEPFWSILLMGVTVGFTAWTVYLSVSQLTTVRMSNLLMTFVGLGTLTSTVTASDPDWWRTHFSHLGTFSDLSSLLFNGTLVVGGMLVVAFAVYVSNDMKPMVASRVLQNPRSPRFVAAMFVLMGVMLAGVGLVPVTVSLLIHNLCASGMALAYTALLTSGPWILRGMPRAYFIASSLFLAAVLLSAVLFGTGFFGLTAFEIVVFALVFGWISVLIRFLSAPGRAEEKLKGAS